jgi:hypothetical protein
MKEVGKRIWLFPDGDLPEPGNGGDHGYFGHESLVILNPNLAYYTTLGHGA